MYDPETIYQDVDIEMAELRQGRPAAVEQRIEELLAEIEGARRLGRDPQRQLCELASIEEEC